MARTPEGKALTEAQRVAQLKAATRTMVKARVAYKRFLDTANLDASFSTWMTLMDQIVAEGFMGSADLAAPYIARFAVAEGAKIPDLPDVVLDHAKLFEDMQVNGPISIKQKIGKGMAPDQAKSAAMGRFLGVVQEHVLNGGRSLIVGASKYYGSRGRWRRVSDGQPCAFCAMLCARGPVYSEETVQFLSHRSCGCGAEMVFGEWEPTRQESLWRASYDAAAMDADDAGVGRLAPKSGPNGDVDTILWRMRRNAPELFSDGVGDSFLLQGGLPLGKNGRPRASTLDGTVHFKKWQERRTGLETQAGKIRDDTGKPVRLPPRLPYESPEWSTDLPLLRAKEWNHILFGDDSGGGHLFGYGWINSKTEFPPSWGPAEILSAMKKVATSGVRESPSALVGIIQGDRYVLRTAPSGRIVTFHRIAD